jgi:hypothetical protein
MSLVKPTATINIKHGSRCVTIHKEIMSCLCDFIWLADTANWEIPAHPFEKALLFFLGHPAIGGSIYQTYGPLRTN